MYGGSRFWLALVQGDDVARAVAAGASRRQLDSTMLPTRTHVVVPVVPPGAAAPVPRVGPAPPRVGRRAREAGGSPRVPLVRRQGRRVGPLARVDERDRRAFTRRWMTTSSAYLVSPTRAPCNDLHDITSRITTRTRRAAVRPTSVTWVPSGYSIENMPTSRHGWIREVPSTWWGGWGSNPRPGDYESLALTTELPPRKRPTGSHTGDPVVMAPGVGLEPTTL